MVVKIFKAQALENYRIEYLVQMFEIGVVDVLENQCRRSRNGIFDDALVSNVVKLFKLRPRLSSVFLTSLIVWCYIEAYPSTVPRWISTLSRLLGTTTLGITTPGNTKGGSITVPLTSCLTGLDYTVLQIKTKIVSIHTVDSKPVKQEVNGTVILPPLVLPDNDKHNDIQYDSKFNAILSIMAVLC
jgi:hypothetical protein